MKFLRPALIVALLCFVTAGAAFADDIHVVFDPTLSTAPLNGMTNIITQLGSAQSFTWFACSSNPDISFFAPGLSGETECAEFANRTGMNITQLTFGFEGNPSIPGADSVSCGNVAGDPHLTTASCGPDGDSFGITFTGGNAIIPSNPETHQESLFFLGEDGVAGQDINNLNWSIAAPEPSSLNLLVAGMGLLGLGLVLAKR
jgi:PEP-CTERM motif-containing protein